MPTTPVFLFAFANDRRVDGQYLRDLPAERKAILRALKRSLEGNALSVVDLPNATREEVYDELLGERGDQVRLFHFGGHADGAALMFETADGVPASANAEGLASLLGKRAVPLVFLNGCATQDQAAALLGAGVASVIVTSEAIDDRAAAEFAARFYQGIVARRSITHAFEDAGAAVKASCGSVRGAYRSDRSFMPTAGETTAWPWRLYAGTGGGRVLLSRRHLDQVPNGNSNVTESSAHHSASTLGETAGSNLDPVALPEPASVRDSWPLASGKRAEGARMVDRRFKTLIKDTRDKVANADLDVALHKLRHLLEYGEASSNLIDDVTTLEGSLTDLERLQRNDLIRQDQRRRERLAISNGILGLLRSFEDLSPGPPAGARHGEPPTERPLLHDTPRPSPALARTIKTFLTSVGFLDSARDTRRTIDRPKLTWLQGIVVVLILVMLNSLLSALGSMLWGHIPYWPAFMVYALACAFFRWWGLAVAVLSPMASMALGIGGAPTFLYVPVNLLQALLVCFAFEVLKIDYSLARLKDKIKYFTFAVTLPSFAGACAAWLLRYWSEPHNGDPAVLRYATWWTTENLLPAVFPGIWLHGIVSEVSGEFAWERGGRPKSWMGKTIEQATPWMATLLIVGSVIVTLVYHQINSQDVTPSIWKSVHEVSEQNPLLRIQILSLCIAILYSLGTAIRFAKQAWVLEGEVSRRLPFSLSQEPPYGHHTVTALYISIRDFSAITSRVSMVEIVFWLNLYFDRMSEACARHGGYVDRFGGGAMILVFGLEGDDGAANDAARCAIDILGAIEPLNEELRGKNYPETRIAIGVDVGPVVAGEIGSRNSVHYTVVGDCIRYAARMEKTAEALEQPLQPIVLSQNVVREAGLFLDSTFSRGLVRIETTVTEAETPEASFYTVNDVALVRSMLDRAYERRVESRKE